MAPTKRKLPPLPQELDGLCTAKKTGNMREGYVFEISEDAGSYRGEQLGMCAVHHLIAAFSLFFFISEWKTKVICDNEGTIKISRRILVRIRATMSCSDILRNIRTSRKDTKAVLDYFHVEGHMDRYFADRDLTLEQWLNKKCSTLAKLAVDK